ncbi:accessory Sec system glycosyltransferase Asp1 [Lactobacillus sp. ESL0791]|uniref:accessory Sec system glycosyltransferase Asp1 n=1 Tax=Lactobacillus sp. ESL0791 TaxID=2983234 RepID=UPI0023F8E138|nr:accessory Sec system glycosyltransferase Asp1 [Lactobacillus sp. ESL0791]MDF7639672.1 accessory Sec system glycosyltransferase Asp1 [Lactobacillus sp. ESL0791]
MLTLIPDMRLSNNFYHQNTLLNLAEYFREAGVATQLLITTEEADKYYDQLARSGQTAVYLFDEILAVNSSGSALTVADLHIPDKYVVEEIIYFNGIGLQIYDGEKYVMDVLLDPNGQVTHVSYFRSAGKIVDDYDLRGFRRSRSFFNQEGAVIKKQWFNPAGDLVMTLKDYRVTIASSQSFRFKQKKYGSLAEVISEFALRHLADKGKAIAEPSSETLALRHFLLQTQFYYYFTEQQQLLNNDFSSIMGQDYYLFQNETQKNLFLEKSRECGIRFMPICHVIKPYFAEFALGTSMEFEQRTIYWHVGQVSDAALKSIFSQLMKLLGENPNYNLFADAAGEQAKYLQTRKRKFLGKYQQKLEQPDKDDQQQVDVIKRFSCKEQLNYEQEAVLLKKAYLFLDTAVYSDYNLQLEAVKTGIPQIVRQGNGLVKVGENGFLLEKDAHLDKLLLPFLTDLSKWNSAVVENVRLIEQLSPGKIIDKWKAVVLNE